MAEKLTTLAKRLRPFINGQVGAIATTGAYMQEGPGIDLVGNKIGLGGDTILLYNSNGTPAEEFAATGAGLTQALAAAASGDLILLYQFDIIGNFTIPAGVTVLGTNNGSILTGTITNNGLLYNVYIEGNLINNGNARFIDILVSSGTGMVQNNSAGDSRYCSIALAGNNTIGANITAGRIYNLIAGYNSGSNTTGIIIDGMDVEAGYCRALSHSIGMQIGACDSMSHCVALADTSGSKALVHTTGNALIINSSFINLDVSEVAIDATVAGLTLTDCTWTGTTTGSWVSGSGDRAVFDALNYQSIHANDIDQPSGIHWTLGELQTLGVYARRYLIAYNYYASSGAPYKIGLAVSSDLQSSTIEQAAIVDIGAGGSWEDAHIKDAFLVKDDSTNVLHLYYAGNDGSQYAIGLSRSYDGGLTWTKYASNPVLSGAAGWEGSSINFPHVIYDIEETNAAKRWKMWYSGNAGSSGSPDSIGYAYSTDGISWTKYASNPVLQVGAGGAWDDLRMSCGPVVRLGNTFYLFYNAAGDADVWKVGLATFTNPESTYTKSANNPILVGDGKTSTITANLLVGQTTVSVTDSTVFPIGAPVWLYDGSNHFLSHIASRPNATSIVIADAAPVQINAAGGNVRSVAFNSVYVHSAFYDGGWRFGLDGFQPQDGSGNLRETSLLGWSNDLSSIYIDYSVGILIPITLADSQLTNVTFENPSILPFFDNEYRFLSEDHSAVTLDADAATVLDITGQEIGLDTQAANTVFAGPTTGAANEPTFRALVATDLPVVTSVDLPYGSFSSSATQTIASATTAYAITYTDREVANQITLSSNSHINITVDGVYLITFSAIGASSAPNKYLDIWLAVDGTNIPRSNTHSEFVGTHNERIITVTFMYEFTAGQYFELYMHSNDTGATLVATAAGANPTRPASPSIIVTVNKISNTITTDYMIYENGNRMLYENGDTMILE